MLRTAFTFAVAALSMEGATSAQSFNIDFGQANQGPPPTYGGAGQAGFWNSLPLPHTSASSGPSPFDVFLTDVNGAATSVRLHQYGGTELIQATFIGGGAPTGNDALLLKDALLTHSIPIKTCLFFNGLQNGMYEVITYAWMPNHPQVTSVVFHDFTPGIAQVGGSWTGQHVEGVTFARHFVTVTNGFMGPHAGLPDNGNTALGGPMNGIQLRYIVASTAPVADGWSFAVLILAVAVAGTVVFRRRFRLRAT